MGPIDAGDISRLCVDLIALKSNIITFNEESLPQIVEVGQSIERLTKNLQYQSFIQEWNMAVEYFKNKRPGAIPDDTIIEWIANNRIKAQKDMEKCDELYNQKMQQLSGQKVKESKHCRK
jgi:hypothetical protein